MRRLILCSLVLLLASGCGILSKPKTRQLTLYQLTPVSTSAAAPATATASCAKVLRIQSVEAEPPYASDDLLYTESPQVLASFAYHRWATSPATMLTGDLLGAVSAGNIYRSVLGPSDPGQADLLLAVRINEGPLQVFRSQGKGKQDSTERLSYTATLTDAGTGNVLATRMFSASREAAPDPYHGVQAANAIVTQLDARVVSWLRGLAGSEACK